MTSNFQYLYKIILIGDSGVGKSNIVLRFTENDYTKIVQPTIGIDFRAKTLTLDNDKVRVHIWDTAGQERFKSISASYYRLVEAIIIVFDLTKKESFNNIDRWISAIENTSDKDLTDMELLIIGNKSDLADKVVSNEEIKQLHDKYSFVYIETSAKNNVGIDNGLSELIKRVHKKNQHL